MGPFEMHLREAIALNRERAPRYARESNGASRNISRALIGAEVLLLPIARWYDRRAAPYHHAGVPLLEQLFVPMTGARDYGAPFVVGGPPLPSTGVRDISHRVRAAFQSGSFAGATRALEESLGELTVRGGNYLLRHLLESALRLSVLAPRRVRESKERDLPSPSALLAMLLRMHLRGFRAAAALDRRAHELHLRGVGILANDLPTIEMPAGSS